MILCLLSQESAGGLRSPCSKVSLHQTSYMKGIKVLVCTVMLSWPTMMMAFVMPISSLPSCTVGGVRNVSGRTSSSSSIRAQLKVKDTTETTSTSTTSSTKEDNNENTSSTATVDVVKPLCLSNLLVTIHTQWPSLAAVDR